MTGAASGRTPNRDGEAAGRPRRIAMLMPSLAGGGAEKMFLRVAAGLARRGFAVDLLVERATGPYVELVPGEIRLLRLDARLSGTTLPKLLRYVARERPDVLLSNLDWTNAFALIAKKFFARKLRVVVRQAVAFSAAHAESRFRIRIVVMQALKRLLPSADAIVAVSRGVADDLDRHLSGAARDLVRVVPNPVVDSELAARAAAPVAHPWFADRRVPVVLSAGRLQPQKDFPTLLRAFSEVAKARPARLAILGEGPLLEGLRALARELRIERAVDFLGFRTNPFAYMAKARVFALSSAYEGLPAVLIECMACGTPVVATDCPYGPREILEGGRWGRLVPVGDHQSLAGAILDTLDHPVAPGLPVAGAGRYAVEPSVDEYLRVLLPDRRSRRAAPPL